MKNLTNNNFHISALSEQRWSPRAFSSQHVEKQKIKSVLEAARWAPSAFNAQPWRFIIGENGDETYNKILSTLVDWNIKWAGKAPILVLNIAKKTFEHNGEQNVTFKYDLGQAVGIMILEAVNQGLHTHQMSGFDAKKAAELFNISDDFQAVSITAIGYYGNVDELPEDMAGMETKPRERNNLETMVFVGEFGNSLEL
ncbi:MAG: nitroreductase family protein [Bacteroidota bacterium]